MTCERPQVIVPPGLIAERAVVARPSTALLVVLSGTLTALDWLPPPPLLEPPHAATMATLAMAATATSIVRLTRDTGGLLRRYFMGSSYLCLRWWVSPASQ